MASCYSDDVLFEDPAFGRLKGDHAKAMWYMLLSRDSKPEITFEIIEVSEEIVSGIRGVHSFSDQLLDKNRYT